MYSAFEISLQVQVLNVLEICARFESSVRNIISMHMTTQLSTTELPSNKTSKHNSFTQTHFSQKVRIRRKSSFLVRTAFTHLKKCSPFDHLMSVLDVQLRLGARLMLWLTGSSRNSSSPWAKIFTDRSISSMSRFIVVLKWMPALKQIKKKNKL